MVIRALCVIAPVYLAGMAADGAPVTYTEETAYVDAIGQLSGHAIFESFEDDAAWGGVRSTIVGGTHTSPSITSRGINWIANNAVSQVTTGPGAARTGNWGFYTLPHGDYLHGIGDGFRIASAIDLFGVGGWVETNTPYAEINMVLDGITVLDFGDPTIGAEPRFFGVVDSAGFRAVEIREIEGTFDDQKYIFADDFIIARAALAGDYSRNGMVDAADFVVWRDTDGQSGTGLAADGDGSGTIDAGDYAVWKMHFGEAIGGSSNSSGAIPEPATAVILSIGMLYSASRRQCIGMYWLTPLQASVFAPWLSRHDHRTV